jgi:hypothetical protein
MQKLSGTLTVIRYNGRNGTFNAGKLDTDIGKFSVSDSALDQFAPGQYQGEFLITRIFIKTDTWQDNPFIKLMATVAQNGYLIHDAEERDSIQPAVEPDDMDSDKPTVNTAPAAPPATPTQTQKVATDTPTSPPDEEDYEGVHLDELFGIELGPQVDARITPIKLDPTVGRAQLRLQADYLKSCDYRFDAAAQQWNLKETNHG